MHSWSRTLCAFLFTSGCLVAAALMMLCGPLGAVLGTCVLVLAFMAADRADPTKWSHPVP